MTVSSSTNKIIGNGNGVTTSWPFSFKVFDPEHLVVTYTDAGGDETTLEPGDYGVSLNADQDSSPGGTVTYGPAIAGGTKLTILRSVPYTQAIDLKNQGGFFPEVLERGIDLMVMQVQQLREQLARALKLSPSQSAIGELEATDAARANTFLGFGPTGSPTLFTGLAAQAVSSAMQPVVTAASLALARAALVVPGLGANSFTGAQTLPGNASNPLEAVPKQQAESIASVAAAAAALAAMPVGTPLWWPTETPPAGYLVRDGSLISRTTYAALFAVLVTTSGYTGQTFAVTIASPGVVTKVGHGFTGGERLRLSTTGALPTGLNTTDDFFVIFINADTFRLATTEANAAAGTAVNTSGGQSGSHTYMRSLFGLGDGSTTFKLPDDRDVFVRGKAASGRAIASYQADDNKAHSHLVDYQAAVLAGGVGGNAINQANNASVATQSSGGTETRPRNRAYLPIIKYQ
ncbi:MAG: tail fiber protein [Alphaproteobacteria bacterium]|nr:tail fiber protein [Alphaproteobacteria bacterium]MCW5743815.1 tail fiber protein [Alphaproteobacteria bacterium]